MVMNGYDTDGDGENNFYTVNGRTFYYARYPIKVKRGELVRVYLANLTEFDLINSFHLHANFFHYQPTGTGDHWEYTDTVMQCQGQRGVLEIALRRTPARSCSTRTSRSSPSSAGWGTSRWSVVVEAGVAGSAADSPGGSGRSSRSCCSPSSSARSRRRGQAARPRRARARLPRTSSRSGASSSQPGEIRVLVRNPQRDAITIALVTVDDAIVPFTTDGPSELGRLRSTTVVVPYDWVAEEPLSVGVTSSTRHPDDDRGRRRCRDADRASPRGFLGYGVIGLLVGVVPVALGLLWLPSLRRLDARWLGGFMALTCGLLTFLGVEALFEAFDLQAGSAGRTRRAWSVLLGVALSAARDDLRLGQARARVEGDGLALALLVAIGIGVHNLGEGLAIGTSFALGELQLGTFLVIGFMVHNVTEGLGIAAPAARDAALRRSSFLGAWRSIAGAPAIFGAWIGGYATNDTLAVLFFGIAAGAALPGRRRGRTLHRAHDPGRAHARRCDRRLPRRDRRDVDDRAPGRLATVAVRSGRSRARAGARAPTERALESAAGALVDRRDRRRPRGSCAPPLAECLRADVAPDHEGAAAPCASRPSQVGIEAEPDAAPVRELEPLDRRHRDPADLLHRLHRLADEDRRAPR